MLYIKLNGKTIDNDTSSLSVLYNSLDKFTIESKDQKSFVK